nr:DUF6455 family protein [uncultured Shimia sp.]
MTHFWLTRSMARVLGVSLSEAMMDQSLSAEDYAAMVTRCRMCPHTEACQNFLGQQAGAEKSAPEFCCHAELFERLAAG